MSYQCSIIWRFFLSRTSIIFYSLFSRGVNRRKLFFKFYLSYMGDSDSYCMLVLKTRERFYLDSHSRDLNLFLENSSKFVLLAIKRSALVRQCYAVFRQEELKWVHFGTTFRRKLPFLFYSFHWRKTILHHYFVWKRFSIWACIIHEKIIFILKKMS